jgi:tRNA-specific 2-thiouridylase
VPFITLDCEAEYKKEVVDYMIREYSEGRVPNPDVFCNKYVKFGVFLKKSLEMGADYVATGHYAEVVKNADKFELHESVDKEKDQSYFVYTLGRHELSHALFPIGHMTKPEVRKLAHKFGLPTATKKDSQGLCFIGKIDMKDFLTHYIKTKEGDVLNTKGEVIGFHDGAIFLTIGQRHGFTVTKKSGDDPRYFVVSKDLEKNTVTVGSKESDGDKINSIKEIVLKDLHLISGDEKDIENKISVRIRYRQQKQACEVKKVNDGWHVVFDDPQSGIAIGQSAVFYDGDRCLGGGIIEKVL